MQSLFRNKRHTSTDSINEILKRGEELEKKGNIVDAYFLYKGLTEIEPTCKACRSHMGQTLVKLQDQGIEISIKQNEKINANKIENGSAQESVHLTVPAYNPTFNLPSK